MVIIPQSYRYDKQPAVADHSMIRNAALTGNAAQRHIMVAFPQSYAKGSLAYAREPFMRREYGKSKTDMQSQLFF